MNTRLAIGTFFALMLVATPSFAVINGTPEGGYPTVGALLDEGNEVICTGTLISSGWVLMAGSCLFDANGQPRSAENLKVCFGAETAGCAPYELDALTVHEGYDGIANDLGMVHIKGAPSTPVLPLNDTANRLALGEYVTWIGFGANNNDGSGKGVKRSELGPVDDRTLLTFQSFGSNIPCVGDAGAPAIMMVNGNPVVVGVVTATDENCSSFVTHIRIDAYLQWINEYVDENTPCAILGGDCPAGSACYPTVSGPPQCFPTADVGLGEACDLTAMDQLQCEDGAVCLASDDDTNSTCVAFCLGEDDCSEDSDSCAAFSDETGDLGTCRCVDEDNDGWCAAQECDDTDASVNPDAQEICGNQTDEDCSGDIDDDPTCETQPDMGGDPDMGVSDMGSDMETDMGDNPGAPPSHDSDDGCSVVQSNDAPLHLVPLLLGLGLVGVFRIRRRRRS